MLRQKKKLLILSTVFFPQPMVASIRPAQWSRFLPEFGWQPTVLCRHYGFTATPELLKEHVHAEVAVEYLNAPPTSEQISTPATLKPLPWWKAWLAQSSVRYLPVPDVSITFWRKARTKVWEAVQRLQPDALLTTGPPHSIHDVGLWLSTTLKMPWVADFADPYLIDSRYGPHGIGLLRLPAHREFERRIYEQASLIVHAIPIHARWARVAYPFARERIITVPGGCPQELVEGTVKPAKAELGRLSVRVVGVISFPEAEKLAAAVKVLIESGVNLELRLVGHLKDSMGPLQQLLSDRLVLTGALRHDKALEQIVGADVLVCSLNAVRSQTMGMSSKLFEYLATGRTVIVINPTRPDRQFLRQFKGVRLLHSPGVTEMAEALRWALNPSAKPPAEQAEHFRGTYNRQAQTRHLAGRLNALVGDAAVPAKALSSVGV